MSTARNFKSMTPVEPTDAQITAFAQQRGVPAIRAAVPEMTTVAPLDTTSAPAEVVESIRLALEVPLYLSDALKRRALDERCSTRFLILKAIRDAGFHINETDMIADGRRVRR